MQHLLEQDRVELSTPALSERCSNQLSYCSLILFFRKSAEKKERGTKSKLKIPVCVHIALVPSVLQKEVIQPHLPVRLPCYDFTLLTKHTFDSGLLAVSLPASGILDSDGVTGGVYKARERIHRGLADPRLLAIPTSCSRVADCNPNWDRLSGICSGFRLRFSLYRPL